MLEFGILGPVEVLRDGLPVQLGGRRQRATLTILLLNANRIVSIERLADALYGDAPPVTAVTQVARQVSALRKAFGPEHGIETRSPGYLINVGPGQLDLERFERGTRSADEALRRGEYEQAADLQREALKLWRGGPLAGLQDEPFAGLAIERLEEIRLAALELRINADLASGRNRELVAELEELVAANPLREGTRGQLMLALYRSGRQADALESYSEGRRRLLDEFGLEPGPGLRELERAILNQAPELGLTAAGSPTPDTSHAILVLATTDEGLDSLLAIAEPLAALPQRELIVARTLADAGALQSATSDLNSRCANLRVRVRSAAFTTTAPADDAARLAERHNVDLVLVRMSGQGIDDLAPLLDRSPADVAVLCGTPNVGDSSADIMVAFSGSENDWAALELGAWLGLARDSRVTLIGADADPAQGKRDASRLLADASLAVQRLAGIETTPLLVEPTGDALVAAVEHSGVVLLGLPTRLQEGLGATRGTLVRDASPPVLLVHAGLRPSGLAPRESRTRFSWSIRAAEG
jgi:DNA-binding SARP family transcriptional activator